MLIDMQGSETPVSYESVKSYVASSGLKKWFVAERWRVSRFQMSALLYPGRYAVALTPEQYAAIAKDLNQPVSYLRDIYETAA